MSEKRYYLDEELPPKAIVDSLNGDVLPIEDEGVFERLVGLLNKHWEQTKRFEKYSQEKSDMLQTVYKEYDEDLSRYEEEIRGLKEEKKELLRERLKGHWKYTEGLKNEIQMLEQINKSQDMEIARQHKLLDAMSSKLRELGVNDVYED